MTKLVDLDHRWALLIGRVFIAFGSIEHLTHECLKEWLKDPIYNHLKNINLSRRIDLVIDLVQTQNFDKNNTEYFVSLCRLAKIIAEKRNILAHNPLVLTLFYGNPDFHEIIQSTIKEDIYITFEELEHITIESEDLANLLIEAKVKFSLEGWKGWPIP